ncbi:hypothetical protein [Planktotalea sp.]|uniref:hypothetical protein n=1 Tax=Planktotalea sp. TaxID=2029877 RepID=UPI003F6ACD83
MTIFPELAEIHDRPVPARRIVNGRRGRKLAMRHMKNHRPLLAGRAEIAIPHL